MRVQQDKHLIISIWQVSGWKMAEYLGRQKRNKDRQKFKTDASLTSFYTQYYQNHVFKLRIEQISKKLRQQTGKNLRDDSIFL